MNDMSKKSQGLYRAEFEHDSCGIGFRSEERRVGKEG